MKVIVLLVCLTTVSFVAAGGDKIIKRNGKLCTCRAKTCDDDISCEEHNCLCVLKNLKALENDKSNKYPKSWVLGYRKRVEKRCRCLKKCEKRCTDDDIEDCTERAWDRFICGWTELAADVLSSCKKGQAEKFLDDIGKISGNCIKKDCKPQCTGDSSCDPLLGAASVKCIKNAVDAIKKDLDDHHAQRLAADLGAVLLDDAKERAKCEKNYSCPIARNSCLNAVNAKSQSELAGVKSSIRSQLGHCTGNNLIYDLVQRITICELKAEK